MKSIIYIIPYFGKLPELMPVWLHTCKMNPTVNWLIFTDDRQKLNYPSNVKVIYMSFEELRKYIQSFFDFEISLERPYKLCDYKVAYGEIFEKYISKYDFWGYCDLDLIWGDIRAFLTDEILGTYDKIGQFGHSTIFRNDIEVNQRYRLELNGEYPYRDVFQCVNNCMFDEGILDSIYTNLGKEIYREINFVDLSALHYNFFISHFAVDDAKKDQIFVWRRGKLFRQYIDKRSILEKEYMYIHFLQRPMDISALNVKSLPDDMIIIPNKLVEMDGTKIDRHFIKHVNRPRQIKYYLQLLKRKKGCFTPLRVYNSFKIRFKGIISVC